MDIVHSHSSHFPITKANNFVCWSDSTMSEEVEQKCEIAMLETAENESKTTKPSDAHAAAVAAASVPVGGLVIPANELKLVSPEPL